MFEFLGGIVDFVGDFFDTGFGGELLSAGLKTAGEFVIGGGASGQQRATQRQPISKVAGGGVATSRVPRPDTPAAPGVVDVDTFHAEWMARMRRFASLAAATDTGGPRTLGTQARRT